MKNKNAITEFEDRFEDDSDNSCYFDFFGSREAAKEAIESLECCSGCTDCKDCSYSSACTDSSSLTGCCGLTGVKGATNVCGKWNKAGNPQYWFSQVPIVENLDEKVWNAITDYGVLKMDAWHTCNTVHCYAGWITHLAADMGHVVEKEVGPEFAAMMIFHKSTGEYIDPALFYGDSDTVFDFIHDRVTEKAGVPAGSL